MKRSVMIFLLLLFIALQVYAVEGEWSFHIKGNSHNKLVEIKIEQDGPYSWNWKNPTVTEEGRIILNPYFVHIDTTRLIQKWFKFDSPTSKGFTVIPWGMMHITIRTYYDGIWSGVLDTKINFKDFGWAENSSAYPSADAGFSVNIDDSTVKLYTSRMGGEANGTNYTSASATIWGIWQNSNYTPDTLEFLPPIFLKNVINGNNAGGTLRLNFANYNSGDTVLAEHNINYTIGTNNERFEIFQGSGITYKHNNWNSNPNDDSLSISFPNSIW